MSNSLTRLSAHTNIVADTADYNAIRKYKVTEATTNPSIILQTASLPQYQQHLKQSAEYGLKTGEILDEMVENAMDMINVSFGEKILEVTNKVHVQIDPRLAFDIERSVNRALKLVKLFEERNIGKSRIVIKLPATWEGIQAAKILQNHHGVDCNMTTMFNLVQAAACADAGVSCLAPFVGKIGIWYEQKSSSKDIHPGVTTLKLIQSYMRKFGYKTKVMGAYFVNANEVRAVSGCDIVTLPIQLIEELIKSDDKMEDNMDADFSNAPIDKLDLNEDKFRWLMNEDVMAVDLLSEVIRNFTADYVKLEGFVKNVLLRIKK